MNLHEFSLQNFFIDLMQDIFSKFTDNENLGVKYNKLPKFVKKLTVGYNINLSLNTQLRDVFDFETLYNINFSDLSIFNHLTHLTLMRSCKYDILLPSNLIYLNVTGYSGTIVCNSLKILILNDYDKINITDSKNLKRLEIYDYTYIFKPNLLNFINLEFIKIDRINQTHIDFSNFIHLKCLVFGKNFESNYILPNSIEILKFYKCLHKINIAYLTNLKSIEFRKLNKNFFYHEFPLSLEFIKFKTIDQKYLQRLEKIGRLTLNKKSYILNNFS